MLYEVKGEKRTTVAIDKVLAIVKDAIDHRDGDVLKEGKDGIEFTGYPMRFLTFSLVSHGFVSVTAEDGITTLRYRLRLDRFYRFAVVGTIGAVIFFAFCHYSDAKAHADGWFWVWPATLFILITPLVIANQSHMASRFFDKVLNVASGTVGPPGRYDRY